MSLAFDGPNKVISLSAGTSSLGVRDLWSRWVDWVATGDNSKYLPAFTSIGGDEIDASSGTYIPVYAFLQNGWRIKPQEANHTLNVSDGILLVAGGGDPFVNTNGSFVVRVNYQQPVQAISFSTGGGGGGLTTEQAGWLQDIAKIHGLIPGVPLVITPTSQTAGDVELALSEAGTTITATRQ